MRCGTLDRPEPQIAHIIERMATIMSTQIIDQSTFGPTPLTPRMAPFNHGNKWHSWRGLHIPDSYEGLSPELKALHRRAVIEDKSPMNYYSITGPDAARYLDYLVTRDLTRVDVGAGIYTPWLDEHGKVVIDTPVLRVGDSDYVTMGGILESWLALHAGPFDVNIADQSDVKMVIPLQGPASRDIIEGATGEDWSEIRFMHGRATTLGSKRVWVWRAGYNAQLGYEVHCDRDDALDVFDAVMAVGENFGLMLIGQNSVQVARTEAGLIVPGIDYTRAGADRNIAAYALLDDAGIVSPFEIGLGRFVNFDKPASFIGKEAALDEQASGGPARALVGLEVAWRDIVRLYEQAGESPEVSRRIDYRRHPLWADSQVVGKATSMCWSPTVRKEIALAQVDRELAAEGTELTMEWREHGSSLGIERADDTIGGTISATVVPIPFVSKSHKFGSEKDDSDPGE